MWAWLSRRSTPPPVDLVDDGSFVVRAESFDPAASDQAVLVQAAGDSGLLAEPAVLRHHFLLPRSGMRAVSVQLHTEGYAVSEFQSRTEAGQDAEMVRLRADRTVVPSGLLIAQERARLASLVTRQGGEVRGWQILAPPHGDDDLAGYDQVVP